MDIKYIKFNSVDEVEQMIKDMYCYKKSDKNNDITNYYSVNGGFYQKINELNRIIKTWNDEKEIELFNMRMKIIESD